MIETSSIIILIHLIIAHVVVDFLLQPDSWIEDKRNKGWKSNRLLAHSILAGIVPLILIWRWDLWYVFLIIGITHYMIDAGKCYFDDDLKVFTVDQTLHLAVVILSWLFITGTNPDIGILNPLFNEIWNNYELSTIFLAAFILLWPTGIAIGRITEKWRRQVEKDKRGLDSAGRYIGYAERMIIFSLILVNQYTALGFIVATKSIFRMREGSKEAEYYLIGSMLSFFAAIVIGLVVKQLISM
ncbi:MAG: DUF3307 domain-containing protein [Methanomassiliicoccales archaeon]